jgi:lipid A disaccharide synthetase
VNIILGGEICREFIQGRADPKLIADETIKLLGDDRLRGDMVDKFKGLRSMLSGRGGSRRVAEMSEALLDRP